MWSYEKRLQFPVKIACPDARSAKVIITQYGGPDGELGASMRYLSQRYSMPDRRVAGLLTDIGGEVPKLPRTPLKPAWGQDFGGMADSRGIEVSKLHLAFSGKADKRFCRALETADMEKAPEISGAWEVKVLLGLER